MQPQVVTLAQTRQGYLRELTALVFDGMQYAVLAQGRGKGRAEICSHVRGRLACCTFYNGQDTISWKTSERICNLLIMPKLSERACK